MVRILLDSGVNDQKLTQNTQLQNPWQNVVDTNFTFPQSFCQMNELRCTLIKVQLAGLDLI